MDSAGFAGKFPVHIVIIIVIGQDPSSSRRRAFQLIRFPWSLMRKMKMKISGVWRYKRVLIINVEMVLVNGMIFRWSVY